MPWKQVHTKRLGLGFIFNGPEHFYMLYKTFVGLFDQEAPLQASTPCSFLTLDPNKQHLPSSANLFFSLLLCFHNTSIPTPISSQIPKTSSTSLPTTNQANQSRTLSLYIYTLPPSTEFTQHITTRFRGLTMTPSKQSVPDNVAHSVVLVTSKKDANSVICSAARRWKSTLLLACKGVSSTRLHWKFLSKLELTMSGADPETIATALQERIRMDLHRVRRDMPLSQSQTLPQRSDSNRSKTNLFNLI